MTQVRSNGELVEQEKTHREKLSELRDSFHEQLKSIQEEKDKQLHEEAQATAKGKTKGYFKQNTNFRGTYNVNVKDNHIKMAKKSIGSLGEI